mmetsp:Transcript_38080/g.73150  ORF Transcript_38080/g.73150 Transcript_38080/m.73150 type:complete len:95 (+) Transcript_38080:75-359(+)
MPVCGPELCGERGAERHKLMQSMRSISSSLTQAALSPHSKVRHRSGSWIPAKDAALRGDDLGVVVLLADANAIASLPCFVTESIPPTAVNISEE